MATKLNEYDYLFISARIHALENKLLTRDRMERMLEAPSVQEAAKILVECGYPELSAPHPAAIEEMLSTARLELFAELSGMVPNPALVDVFRIKYDYHNAKSALKAQALGGDPTPLFLAAGRYDPTALADGIAKGELGAYPDLFAKAVLEARDVLAASHDPQAADLILDRAYYAEFLAAAKAVGSAFLEGYVRLSLDSANLSALVRANRMGRGVDFLKKVLIEGGNVTVSTLLALADPGSDLANSFSTSPLKEAAQVAMEVRHGGALTQFERLRDDALTHYLMAGKGISFGEHPVLGYLYAKEAELTTIRIILTGRLAGLDGDILRERLRESYV